MEEQRERGAYCAGEDADGERSGEWLGEKGRGVDLSEFDGDRMWCDEDGTPLTECGKRVEDLGEMDVNSLEKLAKYILRGCIVVEDICSKCLEKVGEWELMAMIGWKGSCEWELMEREHRSLEAFFKS